MARNRAALLRKVAALQILAVAPLRQRVCALQPWLCAHNGPRTETVNRF